MKNSRRNWNYKAGLLILLVFVTVFLCMNYTWSNKLVAAIDRGNHEKFEIILEEKGIYSINLPAGVPWYFLPMPAMGSVKSPLQVACAKGDYEIVEVLIKNGANVNFTAIGEESPLNAVIASESDDKFNIIKLLIKNGADPDKKDSFGIAPILNIAGSNCCKAVDIKHGIFEYDEKRAGEIVKMYQYLIKLVEDPSPADPCTGENTLIVAARMGNYKLLEYLIKEQKLDINAKDLEGRSALFLDPGKDSADDPLVRIAELLIDSGVDMSIKDDNGKTAYRYSIEQGYTKIADVIKHSYQ